MTQSNQQSESTTTSNPLEFLVENFVREEVRNEQVHELTVEEKIEWSIREHVRKELQKGKKYRTIKREVFRKTGIKI